MRRILFVDDEPGEHKLFRLMIGTRIPVSVTAAFDGEEALHHLKSLAPLPHLVITDFNMPRMGGLQFIRALRARHDMRSLPVVVLTNSRYEKDAQASLASGANAFATKPADLDEYEALLTALVHRWAFP